MPRQATKAKPKHKKAVAEKAPRKGGRSTMLQQFQVYAPPKIVKKLDSIAKRLGRTRSEFLRVELEAIVDKYEAIKKPADSVSSTGTPPASDVDPADEPDLHGEGEDETEE